MPNLPILLGLLIALVILSPLLRVVIALVAGRSVGETALAQVPEVVNLDPTGPDVWKNVSGAANLTARLHALGFVEGGTFRVREMDGVVLRLFSQSQECVMGIVYEHPQVGQWIDLVTRYSDGTTFGISTSRDTGLAQRPGHVTLHMPGTEPGRLHQRLLAERPPGGKESVRAADLRGTFERGYAESMAWRKTQGISRTEVVKVATRKIA